MQGTSTDVATGAVGVDGEMTKRKRWSRDTKAQIVEAATTLFSARGYANTTIEQIGNAVGLTGPAIYRHFDGKAALFEAVMLQAQRPAWEETQRLIAAGGDERETLRRSIAAWVRQTVDCRSLVNLYVQQHRSLDEGTRTRISVQYRELTAAWTGLLGDVHPELGPDERATMVEGAMWLLRSPAFFRPTLTPERLSELITSMMRAALFLD